MPSYLEIIVLLFLDMGRAASKWWRLDRAGIMFIWRIPFYWWRRTARGYIIIILWKLKQLFKLSIGWWDRETIEAFSVREKVSEGIYGPFGLGEQLVEGGKAKLPEVRGTHHPNLPALPRSGR